ncbi:MAG: GNAT family N-acetyltransferase [Planctomycetota bacterium]
MPPSPFRIVPFHPELASTFQAINEEWITSMFQMEDSDRALLETPQESIVDRGGFIWFVEHEFLGLIGTCALVQRDHGAFELTKMGVLASSRGLKAGEFLLQAVLQKARDLQLEPVFLLTNSACEAAIHLYRKHGFQDDAGIMRDYAASYERCDVAMLWRR